MPISLGFGELGCPYHCDTSTKCPCSLRGGRIKGMGWGRREKKAPLPIPLPAIPYPFRRLLRSLVSIYSGNSIWRRAQGLAKNLFAITSFLFIEVLFRTFLYCYWGKGNCSLYRGLGYIEVLLYGGVWQGPTLGVIFTDVSVRELIMSQKTFYNVVTVQRWSDWSHGCHWNERSKTAFLERFFMGINMIV